MTDFLDEKQREIKSRMDELAPLVAEHERLTAAYEALTGVVAGPAADGRRGAAATAAKPRRARGASTAASTNGRAGATGRRGRPKGSGTRANEALSIVRDRPGVTIPEIAEAMGMKQNYLYRVMPELQKDGMVRKEGRGWHSLEAA